MPRRPALARAAVGTPWNTPLFRRHLSGASDGDWPVAAMEDAALKSALGANSGVVRLSGETAAKQTVGHHGLMSADYALVQRILDEGELFAVGKHHAMGFLQVDGKMWSAVVKATGDGSRNYLVSLHRGNRRNLQRVRVRSRKINRLSWGMRCRAGRNSPRSPEGMRVLRNASGTEFDNSVRVPAAQEGSDGQVHESSYRPSAATPGSRSRLP